MTTTEQTPTTTSLGVGHTHDVTIGGTLIGQVHRLTSGTWNGRTLNDGGQPWIGLPFMSGDTFDQAVAKVVGAWHPFAI